MLTVDETTSWLAARDLTFRPALRPGADHRLDLPATHHRIWFETPPSAKRQMSLTHLLASWFKCEGSMLAINVVALFQPHELEALLFLRRSYGEERWIDGVPGGATPGHQFVADPMAAGRQVREFMRVMLAYTFEGYMVQDDGSDIIWLADEVIDIYSPQLERIHAIKGIIDTLGLEFHGAESPFSH